ncbi:hypothetical protein [Gordonia humi]|uniref:Putative Zn finger protein n=1 Tax=Gordonia humi TaxID=686429 RepID=A0A840F4G3_9ACTN|nr:hypothetical protein [Gordonia humi]MBB4136786.1 putative Zn finger protein [Gordonia humi]
MGADFGFTAWGRDVVRIAEPVSARTPNTSAPRARSIARNGGVTLDRSGRQITARIHRGSEASVAHLEFAAPDPGAVAALREETGSRTEPDDAVHAALRTRGLLPALALEAADCSCRARTTMCVHVLAAVYAVAALVDHEPATLFTLLSGSGAEVPSNGPTPRWTPIAALDVRDYWTAR